MRLVRWIGFGIAAVGAVVVFFLLAPDAPDPVGALPVEGIGEMAQQAVADYDSAVAAAGENVELQMIANGWIARDLLFIHASELQVLIDRATLLSNQLDTVATASQPDDRVPALVLIGVITFAFHAASLPPPVRLEPESFDHEEE